MIQYQTRMPFKEIPILDLSLARSEETMSSFLNDLRHALLEVGFLYLKNTGISPELSQGVIEQGKSFFDLPMEKKLEVEMKNAPSFLGYHASKPTGGSRSTYPPSTQSLARMNRFIIISLRPINGLIPLPFHISGPPTKDISGRWEK